MSAYELYRQSIIDLQQVSIILFDLLAEKELNGLEQDRVAYCVKLVKSTAERQLYINEL